MEGKLFTLVLTKMIKSFRFHIFSLIGVIIILLITGCTIFGSKKKSGPELVAEKYICHLSRGEYDEAKKYGTQNTAALIEIIKTIDRMDTLKSKTKIPAEISGLKCTQNEGKAKCTYFMNGQENNIELLNVDGKWLVEMGKETEPVY